jgi:hypothetical protein
MIVFFSHPLTTYNTQTEDKCLKYIQALYPNCEIINPSNIEITIPITTPQEFTDIMRLYILPIVRSSNLLAYYKDESFAPGVDMEIAEATRLHIPIIDLRHKVL